MVKRTGSGRKKSRKTLMVPTNKKSKLPIKEIVQTFKEGDKVLLKVNPSFHKGAYHMRFHGLIGDVVGVQGGCYLVSIHDGGKRKSLIVNPVHLRRA
ncbi:MAG: 50S ribosomal protein L21e [Candidatus Woesearchaeota archaeon]